MYVYDRRALGQDFTPEQVKALTSVTPAEIAALPVDARVELALRHHEVSQQKRSVFWEAVQVALPIATFLGIGHYFSKRSSG